MEYHLSVQKTPMQQKKRMALADIPHQIQE
jgi:hypothetical protein